MDTKFPLRFTFFVFTKIITGYENIFVQLHKSLHDHLKVVRFSLFLTPNRDFFRLSTDILLGFHEKQSKITSLSFLVQSYEILVMMPRA